MRFVIFQINTDFLINQLKKHFYRRNFTPFFYFKKIVLRISESFRSICFLPHFYWFSYLVRYAIFKVNTNLLINQQIINNISRGNLFPFFILKKKCCSPSQRSFETSNFHHVFTIFNIESGF